MRGLQAQTVLQGGFRCLIKEPLEYRLAGQRGQGAEETRGEGVLSGEVRQAIRPLIE